MDLAALIAQISRDADPGQPGFQAQAVYVVLSLCVPLVVGSAVAAALRVIENLFGAYDHGQVHHR